MSAPKERNSETQMQAAISSLLEAAADSNTSVVEIVNTSLHKLADKHTNEVLTTCCQFGQNISKTNSNHLASVLNIIQRICEDFIHKLEPETASKLIKFSLEILIQNAAYEPNVQTPASEILVALGRQNTQVVEYLMGKLETATVPHYMVPHTLGALATMNPSAFVPHFRNIFAYMIPMLGGMKSDLLKQSFSYAIGCFSEALMELASSNEPSNILSTYHIEMGIAFDVLFSSWLQTKEPKVVESVLNSLSAVYVILSPEKVTQQTPKVVITIINLYKKNIDTYYITKCLGSIIKTATSVNGTLLEPLLSTILNALADRVCVTPDYVQPESLKTHSEVLRCYECLATHFTDHTLDYLLWQLKNNNDKERIKGLLVLTHLINSLESAVHSRAKDILRHLNEMLHESNIFVRKVLLKAIVACSIKGYMCNTEINPNGPEKYMEFIIQLCCKQITLKTTQVNQQELWDIQRSADNTIYMLSTSVLDLQEPLWDLLLRCFLSHRYEEACIVMLRCLTHLAARKSSMQNSHDILLRCLSLLAKPLLEFKGTFVLNFLKNVKLQGGQGFRPVFESKIIQLLKYLEQNYDNLNESEWQDLVLDFFSLLLESIKDVGFNELLIKSATDHLQYYANYKLSSGDGSTLNSPMTEEKTILLKCLAITACNLDERDLIIKILDVILENVKLTDVLELHACAEAVGVCSRHHLQVVLDKMAVIRKSILLKKHAKFFNFMKDQKHEVIVEKIRYFVICSYSEICNEAPADLLLKIIEHEILDFVVKELVSNKDFSIRKACLKTIGCVAEAMHPNRNSLHVKMQDRDKVLSLVMSQMQLHSGPEYIELFPVILPVLTSLLRLPLPLESEQRLKLLRTCFDNIYNASAIYCKINPDSTSTYYGDSKLVPYIISSFSKLNQLTQELLLQSLSPAMLDEHITLLETWLNMRRVEQRLPAIETLRVILQTYLDNMKFSFETPSTFGQAGGLLAQIIPRCTDPNKSVCKTAVDCLCLVLCIASRYEGHLRDHDKLLFNSLQHVQQQIDTDDPKLLYSLTTDVAHVVGVNLPQFQLYRFVVGLIGALLDAQESSAIGAAIVLNVVLKQKGTDLTMHVQDVFGKLLAQLDYVKAGNVRSPALKAVLSLATHHPKVAVGVALAQPLPYSQTVCDCWSIFSTELILVSDILDQLKKTIKHTALFEEHTPTIRVANLQPLQAISALHELFKNPQLKDISRKQFPELFSLLLITLASYIGTDSPATDTNSTLHKKEKYGFILNREACKLKPASVALNTFKLYLLCCEYPKTAASLLLCTELDKDINYHSYQHVVENLVESVHTEAKESLSWVVSNLGPCIRAEAEAQRIAAVAFFAFLLKRANNQTMLSENLLEMLLDVQADTSCEVRKLGLRGLGFAVEFLNVEMVARHCNPILSALMQGLDYHNVGSESVVILEAMLSFSKLLVVMEGQRLSSFQVTASVRIKPLLSQEDTDLRMAAIKLFGNLTLSLKQESNLEAFKEQVQSNLVPLVLHLADPEEEVVKACKYTLRKVGPFLKSPKVNTMFQEHLTVDGNLHFVNFIAELTKIMSEELQELFPLLIMTCVSYFKSPWWQIRGQAALMAGLCFSNLSQENKEHVFLDNVCDRLLKLMNDEHPEVRIRTVQAIAYLFVN